MLETLSVWFRIRKGDGVETKNNEPFYFQKDAFVEKLRPVTYYEIVTSKPFLKPIPNSNFVFSSKFQSITAIVRLHQVLTSLIQPMIDRMGEFAKKTAVQESDFTKESGELIQGIVNLTSVIWEFTDKPKKKKELEKMWRAFLNTCLEDNYYLFDIIDNFRVYNQRFFFTLKYLLNFKLVQDAPFKPMDYNDSLAESAETRIKRRSFLHLRGTKLISQARQSHMN